MISGILSRELTSSSAKGVISPITAYTDYENALGAVTQLVEAGDTKHYFTTVEGLSSVAQVSQTWQPTRLNQTFMLGQMEASVYRLTSHYAINDIDRDRINKTLSKSNVGGNAVEWLQVLCKQGIEQKVRVMTLHGIGKGEGILNGASTFVIGNDPQSNSTAVTMNPAFLAKKLMQMIQQVLNQVKNTDSHISFLTSLEIYNLLAYTTIESAQYLSTGSAVSILDYIKKVCEVYGRECKIGYDTTLSKADSTGTKDIILVNAPGVMLENAGAGDGVVGKVNAFSQNQENISYNSVIDVGAAGLYSDVNPTYNGLMSGNSYLNCTSGLVLRSGTVIKAELQYQ